MAFPLSIAFHFTSFLLSVHFPPLERFVSLLVIMAFNPLLNVSFPIFFNPFFIYHFSIPFHSHSRHIIQWQYYREDGTWNEIFLRGGSKFEFCHFIANFNVWHILLIKNVKLRLFKCFEYNLNNYFTEKTDKLLTKQWNRFWNTRPFCPSIVVIKIIPTNQCYFLTTIYFCNLNFLINCWICMANITIFFLFLLPINNLSHKHCLQPFASS